MFETKEQLALRKELTQNFTSEDVADIKDAIDIPRANVTILNTVYSPEETKVGVWREYRTVEGQQVLMQKPVYEKTLFNIAKETLLLTNVEVLADAIIRYKGNDQNANIRGIGDGFTLQSSNYFMLTDGDLYSSSWTSQTGELNKTLLSTTIQYTKTTDEWEVVE